MPECQSYVVPLHALGYFRPGNSVRNGNENETTMRKRSTKKFVPVGSSLVVIDAFRAATTACHVLRRWPQRYLLVADSGVAARLASQWPDSLLIGKPEIGATFTYDVPNSPTRVGQVDIEGRTVIHRTSAGAVGILRGGAIDAVFLAGFINAKATSRAISGTSPRLVPMGHEGTTPSLEDNLAARCIAAHLGGPTFTLEEHLAELRAGPGRYFFGEDQAQYPASDFELCVAIDAFDFAIRADLQGDYARLRRV